jgi:hypothetical protein
MRKKKPVIYPIRVASFVSMVLYIILRGRIYNLNLTKNTREFIKYDYYFSQKLAAFGGPPF